MCGRASALAHLDGQDRSSRSDVARRLNVGSSSSISAHPNPLNQLGESHEGLDVGVGELVSAAVDEAGGGQVSLSAKALTTHA